MAKNFDAKLVISTAEMRKEFAEARGQVNSLTQSLTALNKVAKESQGDLKKTADSIASIVASSRQAASAAKELAQAKIAESRADAAAQGAADKHTESLKRQEVQAARTATENQRRANLTAQGQANLVRTTAQTDAALARQTLTLQRASQNAETYAHRTRAAAASQDDLGNSLSNSRYLLYDVGATYRTLAISLQALPAASLAVAVAYERDFAQVIRTTGETSAASQELRSELKQLATDIPMTFGQLSQIAMIGGQMDIPSESLAKFTETVAKFIATSDGVTIESATQAFGRLANLFASDLDAAGQAEFFERIGSAISKTADESVTSEKAIISMMTKMAAVGSQAGMTAQEVTALASALTSVGIAPELGSGFVTRFFGSMNKAVADGGDNMREYARALGMTSEEFQNLVENNPNGLLTEMLEAMQGMSSVQQSAFLTDLGIKATRDQRVVQALASQLHVLKDAAEDVDSAFNSGSYLDATSNGIFNTMSASLQRLGNSFMNLGDSMGSHMIPVLTPLIQSLTGLVQGFSMLIDQEPGVRILVGTLLTIGGVLGVFLAIKSAQAFVTAGLIGFQHAAQNGTGASLSLNGQLRQLATTMLAAKGASAEMGAALLGSATGAKALGIAVSTTTSQIAGMDVATAGAARSSQNFMQKVGGLGSGLLGMVGGPIGIAITALGLLGTAWLTSASEANAASEEIVSAFKMSAEAGRNAVTEAFASETVGTFTAGKDPISQVYGLSFQQLAKSVGVSMADISSAIEGGSKDLDALQQRLKAVAEAQGITTSVLADGRVQFGRGGEAYNILSNRLHDYEKKLSTSETAANSAAEVNKELGFTATDAAEGIDTETDAVDDLAKALQDAVAQAFGLVDAQGALQSAMESLGEGVYDSKDFTPNTEGGRENLENLKATLAAQAMLLQQSITAGEISAQEGAARYSAFVEQLVSKLTSMGVDPMQIQQIVDQTIAGVESAFVGSDFAVPVKIDAQNAVAEATLALAGLGDWLSENELTANMSLEGADEVTTQAYNTVQYLSDVTGLPFEAVLTALTDPASENASLVAQYMMRLMTEPDYVATLNADTRAGVANVQNFAQFVNNQLDAIDSAIASTMANYNDANTMGHTFGMQAQTAKLTQLRSQRAAIMAPAQVSTDSFKGASKDLGGLTRGFNDAAQAAQKSGSGSGKAAKGAKDAGKAAKGAANDVKKGAEAWEDYANRLGKAFDQVYDKTYAVGEAIDNYYSVLNGIKKRRQEELQTIRDLRAEIKSLNNERKDELIEAKKYEEMAKLAAKHGNTDRAEDYANEAKTLRDSAKEKETKIKADEKEIKTITTGRDKLDGYSDAAIRNREELRSLEKAAMAIPGAYAATGASTDTVRKKTEEWTGKLIKHTDELTDNNAWLGKVKASTDKYVGAVKSVPKTVTTTVNLTDNASGKVGGVNKALGGIPRSRNVGVKANVDKPSFAGAQSAVNKIPLKRHVQVGLNLTNAEIDKMERRLKASALKFNVHIGVGGGATGGSVGAIAARGFAAGGLIPGRAPSDPSVDNRLASVDGRGMIAVRSQEYIVSQPAVNYYGQDFMDKLNQMKLPKYWAGGSVGGGGSRGSGSTGLVNLSAETVKELARAISQMPMALYADAEKIADTVNRGNVVIAQKGGRGVV